MSSTPSAPETCDTTVDVFLGNRLQVTQPAKGYRAGLDAVLLAAAAPIVPGSAARVLDAGAGVGVVGLCVAARCPDAQVTLVEIAPVHAALARHNAIANGLDDRITLIEADLLAPQSRLGAAGLAPESFDIVLANPPYLDTGSGRTPLNALKARSLAMPMGQLEPWARALARFAAPGGEVVMVHRADALAQVLDALGGRFGGLEVLPIHPREGEPAHRILVRGRKGSRAALTLLPGRVLHGAGNRFLPEIEAVLRDGVALAWREGRSATGGS